jgi:azurin
MTAVSARGHRTAARRPSEDAAGAETDNQNDRSARRNAMFRSKTARRSMLASALVGLFAVSTALAAEPRIVKLKGTDAMQFDVKKIEAKPGEALKVQLTSISTMSKQEMAHNFTLLAKDAKVDAFIMEASMARNTEYIPASKKSWILATTKLAGGGETVEVTFNAPKEPGEYVYVCTFPGHYLGGMKGVLVVK